MLVINLEAQTNLHCFMSLSKNIGIGRRVFDFRHNINFKDCDLVAIEADWRNKSLWPTDEEILEATGHNDVQQAKAYPNTNYKSVSIEMQYFIKSQFDGSLIPFYDNLLIIREHRISVNMFAKKYVERLKTFGYEILFRDELNYYIIQMR